MFHLISSTVEDIRWPSVCHRRERLQYDTSHTWWVYNNEISL